MTAAPAIETKSGPRSHRGGAFPNLDAYRGIGMIMVMTNHAAFASNLRAKAPVLNSFIARFDISIPVFFMVSGFLLFLPYVRSLLEDRAHPSWRPYARNRVLRVMPAYWVAMAGVMIWFGIPTVSGAGIFDHHPLGPLAFYGLLLQTFSASSVFHGFDVFDQAWSIGTEVTFYAALPLAAWTLHRWLSSRDQAGRIRGLLWAMAAVILAAQVWRVGIVVGKPSWQASAAFWLPAHMDFFAVGMAMAVWQVAGRLGLPLPRPVRWVGEHPWGAWAAAGLLWCIVVNPFEWSALGVFTIKPSPLTFTAEYAAKQAMYCLVGFAWLGPAVFGAQREGSLRKMLGSRPLAALGTISLGFYLWHKAWLKAAEHWTGAKPFQGSFSTLWVITLAGGLLCGTASYLLVERPLLARKARG